MHAPVVTFGEIMGRLSPAAFERLRQALPGELHLTFAGAEANVAASLAILGCPVRYVTALPQNPLADACVDCLRGLGIDVSAIVRSQAGRLGLYFVEAGANQRPSQVIYDRAGSTISLTPPEAYRWTEVFSGARWLHVSGITPAISSAAAESTRAAVHAARQAGLTVSCDLNFRKKLWQWDSSLQPQALAERTMRGILAAVDVVIANESDCADVLGIAAERTDVEAGELAIDHYPEVAARLIEQFPQVSQVAITLRESHSASHNDWGGMLYVCDADHPTGAAYFAPQSDGRYEPYPIRNIVDRVGAGDAFAAGLIFARLTPELSDPRTAVRFAVAASCLAHSIPGDFNYSSREEIEALVKGSASGRVLR
jgi:2-dehydro-3-deoxygluconokinase